jgi:predicted nicotinamide N-methyase
MTDFAAFIRSHTQRAAHPFVPEIALCQGGEVTPLWQAVEAVLGAGDQPPPFWAYAWPGGAALARLILDEPQRVQGKRVLDFACGSGIGAIAAAKAGAAHVAGADCDPFAQCALHLNAALNGVVVETRRAVDLAQPCSDVDLILAGDICYEQVMSVRLLRWLRLCRAAGIDVLLGDPGRAYAPKESEEKNAVVVARYVLPVRTDLEERDTRDVVVWEL